MIYILTTYTVTIGKKEEFTNMIKEITALYEKHGGKQIGAWWTIGGEANEAVWIHAWKDLGDYEKGQEAIWKDKNFPIDKFASAIITNTDKILKPLPASPLK